MTDHDVIVVGGGHNGLVAAAYLARAGLDTIVLEARSSVGGCAATVDALGVRVNICNCDHVMVRGTPIVDELDLGRHGLHYLDLTPHAVGVSWDGAAPWFAFSDLERTLDSLAVGHADQVEGYRRWIADALPVADLVLAVTNEVPKPGTVTRRVWERKGAGVGRLLAWNRMSAEAVLRTYLTDETVMATVLSTAPTVWGLAPDTPGTGLAAINFAMRHLVQPGRPIGGSGAFPDAVQNAFEEAGGKVLTEASVAAVVVRQGRVAAVRLEDGTEMTAARVVCAVDPYRLFVEWLDGPLPETKRWARRSGDQGYESKIDAVLSERPRLRALDPTTVARHGPIDPLVPTIKVAPRLAEMARNHRLLGEGRVGERPVLYLNVPSVLDETMRDGSRHVFSLEALFTPYSLRGGWEQSKEPERWLHLVASLMEPGFLESIVDWRHVGPRRYESEFGMRSGYATSFAGGPLAALSGRPRELTRYRTSVKGLYLTGAATFPGAGVWGAPGRNAASVVIGDLA